MTVEIRSSRGGAFFFDERRGLVDVATEALVALPLKEYRANGLHFMLAKAVRVHVKDRDIHGALVTGVCSASSQTRVVYADMDPVVLGSHEQVQARYPELAAELFRRGHWLAKVTLAVLVAEREGYKHDQPEHLAALEQFLVRYERRATWLENHPIEVLMGNEFADDGDAKPFDWATIFPEGGE